MVVTTLGPEQVREAVDQASRRGKMPGLSLNQEGCLFGVSDFGGPFESTLRAHLRTMGDSAGRGAIAFSIKMKPVMPVVYALLLLASIWPGIWLTDSMVRAYFPSLTIPTWWWYLPLTVPTAPWAMWSAVRKSRASARAQARELIVKIGGVLGAEVVPAGSHDTQQVAVVQCSP